jgi:hypothetical protein
VIIGDLDFIRIVLSPYEADPPLIVYANGMLSFSLTSQFLQPIPRGRAKIVNAPRIVQHSELPQSSGLDIPRQSLRELAPIDLLGFFVGEGFDHDSSI